jgi:hypothetical protein
MTITKSEKEDAIRKIRKQLSEWRKRNGLTPKPSEES